MLKVLYGTIKRKEVLVRHHKAHLFLRMYLRLFFFLILAPAYIMPVIFHFVCSCLYDQLRLNRFYVFHGSDGRRIID